MRCSTRYREFTGLSNRKESEEIHHRGTEGIKQDEQDQQDDVEMKNVFENLCALCVSVVK